MRYSAICVDDEPGAHHALLALLGAVPDIDVVATCTSAAQAHEAIRVHEPDLLLLDIEMPRRSGIDLLRTLSNAPVVVLLTAHRHYALEAFELGVRDYLLKPVSARRLQACLSNVRPLLAARRLAPAGGPPARLAVKAGLRRVLIDPSQVSRIDADGGFSTIHEGERRIFASESMKDLQQRLAPFGFVRTHKSHLVNARRVRSIDAHEVLLDNGFRVPIGRAYRAAVVEALQGL
jgi:DNA-binding LytR/AlgR family response regulator